MPVPASSSSSCFCFSCSSSSSGQSHVTRHTPPSSHPSLPSQDDCSEELPSSSFSLARGVASTLSSDKTNKISAKRKRVDSDDEGSDVEVLRKKYKPLNEEEVAGVVQPKPAVKAMSREGNH